MAHRVIAVALAAALATLGAEPARAQGRRASDPEAVELTARNLLDTMPGDPEMVLGTQYNALLITAKNLTGSPLRGRVVVDIAAVDVPSLRHTVALDLPAHASRQVQMTLFVPERTFAVDAEFETAGLRTEPRRLIATTTDRDLAAFIVPRSAGLTPAVADAQAATLLDRTVLPVDPLSGDPVLPREAAGWASASLVVAAVSLAERADAEERAALRDWVQAGGRLVLFAADAGELRRPLVTELAGAVEVAQEDTGQARAVGCGPAGRPEAIGCSRPFGLGRVFVSVGSFVGRPTEELMAELWTVATADGSRRLFPFGRSFRPMYRSVEADLDVVAPALDPNQSFRLAIPAVALIILVYVALVGPINFAVVRRLRRPALALATTPLLALLALGAIGLVGVADKGVRLRARTVEFVELLEGDRLGASRAYTGLFFGHPATFDLPWPAGGMVRLVRTHNGEAIRALDYGGGPPTYRDVEGRFWGTSFTIEERPVDLGGAIGFERDAAGAIVAVTNGTHQRFRGALLLSSGPGSSDQPVVRSIGPIEPGGRTPVPTAQVMLPPVPYTYQASQATSEERSAARALDLDVDVGRRLVFALFRTTQEPPYAGAQMPETLIARVDPPQRGPAAGLTRRELDLRLLCVRPEGWTLSAVPLPDRPEPVPAPSVAAPSPGDAGPPDAGTPQEVTP